MERGEKVSNNTPLPPLRLHFPPRLNHFLLQATVSVTVMSQSQCILRLIHDAAARGAVHVVVLGAAQLVHGRLRVRLG